MTSYSLADVAQSDGVSLRTVECWISSGELRAINVSRNAKSRKPRLRVLQADLDAFHDRRATDQPPEKQAGQHPRQKRRRVEIVEQFV